MAKKINIPKNQREMVVFSDGPSRGIVAELLAPKHIVTFHEEPYVFSGKTNPRGEKIYHHHTDESELRRQMAEPQYESGVSKGPR